MSVTREGSLIGYIKALLLMYFRFLEANKQVISDKAALERSLNETRLCWLCYTWIHLYLGGLFDGNLARSSVTTLLFLWVSCWCVKIFAAELDIFYDDFTSVAFYIHHLPQSSAQTPTEFFNLRSNYHPSAFNLQINNLQPKAQQSFKCQAKHSNRKNSGLNFVHHVLPHRFIGT